MLIKDQLLKLTRQLLPTGRAFRIGYGSLNEAVERGLLLSEERIYLDSVGILDSILPDNDNFTTADATRWEQRLGLIVNEDVDLQDRKAAILRKMNHPGDIIARQSADYIQDQLQLAGFNVWVHENIPAQSPVLFQNENNIQIAFHAQSEIEHLETGMEHGNAFEGSVWENCVANDINELVDQFFDTGNNLRCTFFIGGQVAGDYVNIDINRKAEFRQLILKLKPTQSVAFLFVNYI
jgi:uncharacterized protein YmfQ (DUF2313 family)